MYIYENGFGSSSLIGAQDLKIRKILYSYLDRDDAFINQTWIKNDNQLKWVYDMNPKRVFYYSGIDQDLSPFFDFLGHYISKGIPTYFIGNTFGPRYFSFWLEYISNYLDTYVDFDPYDITDHPKVYMCLNRKPHPHRQNFVKKLIDKKVLKKGIVSLGTQPGMENIHNLPLPILLTHDSVDTAGDTTAYGDNPITNNIHNVGSRVNWNNHVVNIVSETTLSSTGFISEKTLKPIIGRRPFMILGDMNVYNILHSWGIDTFDDIFGSGYTANMHYARENWVINNIKRLSNKNNLKSFLLSLKPRLDKNYEKLLNAIEHNKRRIHEVINQPQQFI